MARQDALVDAGGLLRLAVAEPHLALGRADELLSARDDPWVQSVARHVRGLALREQGRLPEAVHELRTASQMARRSHDADRLADVRATLGAALAMMGHTRAGLTQLDRAVAEAADPRVRATARMRRGYVLSIILGRHREALYDLREALRGARSLGDRLWEARTLVAMSLLHLDVGDVTRASRALDDAQGIFEEEGQDLEAVQVMHDRGYLAFCRGDLPAALTLYDGAGAGYAAHGEVPAELGEDRCKALLAAGLPDEACAVATDQLARPDVPPVNQAVLELHLALAELARGNADAALVAARSARDRFRTQKREIATARAELVVLSARRRLGSRGNALADAAERLARKVEEARSEDAPVAWLLAGRAAVDVGREASALWASAAQYRRHPSGLVRATGWLAEALDRDRRGDIRGVWHACRRGLDALDDHRATLGSTELRALASVRGDELARLALSHAIEGGSRDQL
ncbi:MAG TPA: hypothetical protein VFI19_02985 [Nocardioides sp.]|nr:hypothetical protein [Nocardioides sp.]